MVGATHVPRDAAAGDRAGFPALAIAHSRKVQKGEDFDLVEVCALWTPGRRGKGANDASVEFAMFGLFDGHGGKACAEHCADSFLSALTEALDAPGALEEHEDADDAFEQRLPEALKRAFATVDEAFLARDVHSGATATICVIRGRCVTTAAVGDSLATLDLGPGIPVMRLSAEHRLDTSQSERKRIEEAGGEVRPTEYEDGPNGERVGVGPLRVWPGGLAVSRSIGDRDGKRGGVISEPEVSMVVVPERFHGARVVLASDGLWDAATPKQASTCVAKMHVQNAATALNKLAQSQKDNRDDITVLVIDMVRDENSKSGPFVVKPTRGDEKARLYYPFSKKAHDPLPSPSQRRAARQKARDDAIAMQAALECARKAEEAEAERSRVAAAASRESCGADNEGGWEQIGMKKKDPEPPAKNRVKDKKVKQKIVKEPKPTSQTKEIESGEVPLTSATKQQKDKKREGRKQQSEIEIPDVSMLAIESTDDGKVTGAQKKTKKAKSKDRARPLVGSQQVPISIPQASLYGVPPPLRAHQPPMMTAQPIPVLYSPMHSVPIPPPGMPPMIQPPHGYPPRVPSPQFFGSHPVPGGHAALSPGFAQPMPNFAPHKGKSQQLMNLMRSGSPPMPPGPPPAVPPKLHGRSELEMRRSELPDTHVINAPATPAKAQEALNEQTEKRKNHTKVKRRGKKERALDRKRLEQAALNNMGKSP